MIYYCPECEKECEMETTCDRYNSERTWEVPVCKNKECKNFDEDLSEYFANFEEDEYYDWNMGEEE
jgi:hypothetical protein